MINDADTKSGIGSSRLPGVDAVYQLCSLCQTGPCAPVLGGAKFVFTIMSRYLRKCGQIGYGQVGRVIVWLWPGVDVCVGEQL